jgi:hypothetical protein
MRLLSTKCYLHSFFSKSVTTKYFVATQPISIMQKTILYKASNKVLATTANRYIETINRSNLAEAKTSLQYSAMVSSNSTYQKTVILPSVSEYSKLEKEANTLRIDSFRAIKRYLSGLLDSPVNEMKEASTTLFPLVDLYSTGLSGLKKSEISAHLTRFVESVTKPEYADTITTLSLTQGINDLKSAVENYEDLFLKRGDANALRKVIGSATLNRTSLINSIVAYHNEVEMMAARTGDENWASLLLQLNERFAELSLSISRTKASDSDSTNSTADTNNSTTVSKE